MAPEAFFYKSLRIGICSHKATDTLQKALGHTTLAMVSRYVHYQKDDLLDAWRQRRD